MDANNSSINTNTYFTQQSPLEKTVSVYINCLVKINTNYVLSEASTALVYILQMKVFKYFCVSEAKCNCAAYL